MEGTPPAPLPPRVVMRNGREDDQLQGITTKQFLELYSVGTFASDFAISIHSKSGGLFLFFLYLFTKYTKAYEIKSSK